MSYLAVVYKHRKHSKNTAEQKTENEEHADDQRGKRKNRSVRKKKKAKEKENREGWLSQQCQVWLWMTWIFLKLFGRPWDIPAKVPGYPAKMFVVPELQGKHRTFYPLPRMWKTPTPLEDIRTCDLPGQLQESLRPFGPEVSGECPRDR